MKTIKILAIAGISSAIMFSCGPKEEVAPSSAAIPNAPASDKPIVAKEVSTASVQASSSTMINASAKVENSKLAKTLGSLSNVTNVDGIGLPSMRVTPKTNLGLEIYKQLRLALITKRFKGAKIEDPNLLAIAYEFTYNFQTQSLDTVRKSDKLIISFPDSVNRAKGVNGGVNNCKFVLSDLEYYKYDVYEDEYPTLLNVELSVDNQKLMGFNFNTSYTMISSSETPVPSSSKTTLLFYPMQLSQETSSDYKTIATSASTLEDLEAGQKLMGYKVSYTGKDIVNQDVDKIEGFAFVGDLALEGYLNIGNLSSNSSNNESQNQDFVDANMNLKFKSYKNGDLFATVKYDVNKEEFYVVYKDESKDKLADFLAPLAEDAAPITDSGLEVGLRKLTK